MRPWWRYQSEGYNITQADDFAFLKSVGDYIFQRHEHGKDITLVYGTSLLDSFGHFAQADVATGLYMAVEFRFAFTVARVDARGDGVGYISCHSSCVLRVRVYSFTTKLHGVSQSLNF